MEKPVVDVADMFLAAVDNHADCIAIKQSGNSVTYREFGAMVSNLAHSIKLGVQKDEIRILIALPKGPLAYASMFASLLCGATYAPINMEAPDSRNRMIADRFEPDIILYQGESPSWIDMDSRNCPHLVKVDDVPSGDRQETANKVSRLAYVMFTSGSTGIPKGVSIGRTGLSTYCNWAIGALALKPGEICTQQPNLAFDLSVIEIFATLCSGATLVPFASRTDRMFPALAVKRERISVWVSVPSVIDILVKSRHLNPENTGTVHTYFFCGEALLPSHLESIFASNPKARVINAYGPTEATVSCTQIELTADNFRSFCRSSVAIGDPIAGMEICLENGANGDEGEIVIYGGQVAHGYWRDEKLSNENFGFREPDAIPYYRTGDWAERIDGNIYFTGRMDRQIKLGGHRIELGDIEVAVRGACCNTGVAAVLADQRIVVFIETKEDLAIAELTAKLRDALPEYMLPAQFRFVEHLQRNANDKIDYGNLLNLARINSI